MHSKDPVEGIVGHHHRLGGLCNPRYQKSQRVAHGKIRRDERTRIPKKIADAGGNAYMTTVLENMEEIKELVGTYKTNSGAEGRTSR
jgi:hypothetical protein